MNILLVGLGPHADRIYLRFLEKHRIKPALVVDLVSQKDAVEKYLRSYDMIDVPCLFVDDKEKDSNKLSAEILSRLTIHKRLKYNARHHID